MRMNIALLFFIIILDPSFLTAEPWDKRCEGAISKLRDAQQEVASAHSDFESAKLRFELAKASYESCSGDCRFERNMVNAAIDDHNGKLRNAKSALSDFQSAISEFSKWCTR